MTIRNYATDIPKEKWNAIKWNNSKENLYSTENILKKKRNNEIRFPYIIPDNYDAKSFWTENITGEPVHITSRSQERRLMHMHKVRKKEKGEKKYDKRMRHPERYR